MLCVLEYFTVQHRKSLPLDIFSRVGWLSENSDRYRLYLERDYKKQDECMYGHSRKNCTPQNDINVMNSTKSKKHPITNPKLERILTVSERYAVIPILSSDIIG